MLQLLGFVIDCPDPMSLATFYSAVTGCELMEGSGDSSAGVALGEVGLTFQRVADYRPPRWPDEGHPKQYHLDFEVDHVEAEQRRVVGLGATLHKDARRTRRVRLAGLHRPGWAPVLPVPPRGGVLDRRTRGVALILVVAHAGCPRAGAAR